MTGSVERKISITRNRSSSETRGMRTDDWGLAGSDQIGKSSDCSAGGT